MENIIYWGDYVIEEVEVETHEIECFELEAQTRTTEPGSRDARHEEDVRHEEDNSEVDAVVLHDDEIINQPSSTECTFNETLCPGEDNEAAAAIRLPNNTAPRKRGRKPNPSAWSQKRNHSLRMHGEEYLSRSGEIRPAKQPKIMENCNCRFRCEELVSAERQVAIFEDFKKLADRARQKAYLVSLIVARDVLRRRPRQHIDGKQKNVSRYYYLPGEKGQDNIRVCQKMFCFIFQISTKVITLMMKKVSPSKVFLGFDHGLTGKTPVNATSVPRKRFVLRHIRMFPVTESHYCRKSSRKLYLSSELNIRIMYRLYQEFAAEHGEEPVSEWVYRSIFNALEPQLSFFHPRKDQCTLCINYKEAEDKSSLEAEYTEHKAREKASFELKSIDMALDGTDGKLAFTVDIQANLLLPQAPNGELYYKRKLNVYNYCIYDSLSRGYCYAFDECNGRKGCSEIALCLLIHLHSLPESINEVTIWSDCCAAQNRNHFLIAVLIYAVNTIPHLHKINVKYLESGHTFLECDSMHSKIETKKRDRKIFTPEELRVVMEEARVNPSRFQAVLLNFSEFYDAKNLAKCFMRNSTEAENGQPLKWLKTKWFQMNKGSPLLLFKYNYADEFSTLNFLSKPVKRRRRSSASIIDVNDIQKFTLPKLYVDQLPITSAKKKDLLGLIQLGIIRPCYESFYANLPTSSSLKETIDDGFIGVDDELRSYDYIINEIPC